MVGELFKLKQGIDLVHVPYRGGGPAITDYVAGRIDAYWDAVAPLLPWIQKGNIKPLAVTSAKRMPDLPNVPTVLEAGMPDLNVFTWTAVFTPAGTARDVTAKLEAEMQKAMADKQVQEIFMKNGYELFPGSPASVTELIRNDLDKWASVVKATGLKAP
jgi:tripartite-type tricarboxylate transporter receptor subunit TctC